MTILTNYTVERVGLNPTYPPGIRPFEIAESDKFLKIVREVLVAEISLLWLLIFGFSSPRRLVTAIVLIFFLRVRT